MIEIHTPIEIIAPKISRYTVGKKFSKLVWDKEFMSWRVFSRGSGRTALIGANNIKGVIFEQEVDAPAPKSGKNK
jgi:hypothetical protein